MISHVQKKKKHSRQRSLIQTVFTTEKIIEGEMLIVNPIFLNGRTAQIEVVHQIRLRKVLQWIGGWKRNILGRIIGISTRRIDPEKTNRFDDEVSSPTLRQLCRSAENFCSIATTSLIFHLEKKRKTSCRGELQIEWFDRSMADSEHLNAPAVRSAWPTVEIISSCPTFD